MPSLLLILLASSLVQQSPPTQDELTDEAACELRALSTAEVSYFQEKDRYSLSHAEIGTTPLPCVDGSRVTAGGKSEAGSCRFLLRIEPAGTSGSEVRLVAVGQRLGAEGMRFETAPRSPVLSDGAAVGERDCEAWRHRSDPLWHYHQVTAEYDCVGGPYAPEHPCTGALRELIALAEAGVGAAVLEYRTHPLARELNPKEPLTDAVRLCGAMSTAADRAAAAEALARSGALVDTVAAGSCRAEGIRAAAARITGELASLCPGPRCLVLVGLLRQARVEGLDALLEPHAERLVQAVVDSPREHRREAIEVVTGAGPGPSEALSELMAGRRADPAALRAVLTRPGPAQRLLALAARDEPLASARIALARGAFATEGERGALVRWTKEASCRELGDAAKAELTLESLRSLAGEELRCPSEVVTLLGRATGSLAPDELGPLLRRLTPQHRGWLRGKLGLEDAARSEALAEIVLRDAPEHAPDLRVNLAVARWLLSPPGLGAIGGRARLFALVFDSPATLHSVDPDAWVEIAAAALRDRPSPQRVRALASPRQTPAQVERLFGELLRTGSAEQQAAIAGGLAEWSDPVFPAAAARACASELRGYAQCAVRVEATLGAPPPGRRTLPPPTHLTPIEGYCRRWERAVQACEPVCGGGGPVESSRLEAASGRAIPQSPGMSACRFQLPGQP